ncbi:MAG TPA: chlorite dismutase family protein [Polyangiaceae bacterium]|jgi:chlorite dismutase|nr:chlorite dismutase family protein [Polyangiaceae bacterium]
MAENHSAEAQEARIEVRERGGGREGTPQFLDRRLFMQLLVFESDRKLSPADAVRNLGSALTRRNVPSVVYEDVNNPHGLGLLSWSEEPLDFATKLRPVFGEPEAAGLELLREFTMFGRSYSTGYETDLEYWLLRRPRETVLNEAWPWAVWYPLRRSGAFERVEPRERGSILREHATIGKAYGAQDLAHDVRLACHGLDANDNEFVIGLMGKDLHPLSHVVQAMRSTRQTSEFINQMGPFFVGRAAFRHAG